MTFRLKTAFAAAVLALTGAFSVLGAAPAAADDFVAFDDIEFAEGAPGISFGLLWGDWTTGPFAMLVKIEAGAEAPLHHHTANYNAVAIQGNWVHTETDGTERIVTPGSYAYQPKLENHGDRCRGPGDCLILVQMDGPNAFIVAE